MERAIWLSYDLGTSVAFLKSYEFERNFLESLKADVGDAVTMKRRSRIYVTYRDDGRMRGSFLFGRRKAPPWTGFGDRAEREFDEDRRSDRSGYRSIPVLSSRRSTSATGITRPRAGWQDGWTWRGPSGHVDAVPCNVIEDVNAPVSAILTFNERDFLDVCLQHDIELLTAD